MNASQTPATETAAQTPASQTPADEVAGYLAGVRAALADLPAGERDGLLEDLPAHLAEVAAEALGPLDGRLGPPAQYAAELRAAAGLDPGPVNGGGPGLTSATQAALLAVGRADRAVGRVIGYPRASDFLRLLRPAWWLLRGYLVGLAVAHAYRGESFGLLPRLSSAALIGWLFIAACVAASIWLGRRRPLTGSWWRIALIAANVVIALVGLNLVAQRDADTNSIQVDVGNPNKDVTNLYPYGPDGRPLSGVRIMDQNGNPFNIGDPYACSTSPAAPDQYRYPLCAPSPSPSPSLPASALPTASPSR